ncbi:MAG: chemotaxis protein CheX [bacterium]|nr:chemotaxis protein CheX [bacterium]
MNVEYINPFIASTINALSVMAAVNPVLGKPYLREDNTIRSDISGSIGIAGEVVGSVALNFPESLAMKITGNMLDDVVNEVNDYVRDTVGEIANMVAGGAKKTLLEKGFHLQIALPIVISGHNLNTMYPRDFPCVVVPFTIDGENFFLEIALDFPAK